MSDNTREYSIVNEEVRSFLTNEILSDNFKSTVDSKVNQKRRMNKMMGGSVTWESDGVSIEGAKEQIKAVADAGFDRVIICVRDYYDSTEAETRGRLKTKEHDCKWFFSQTVDELSCFIEYAKELGLSASVKIHIIDALEQIKTDANAQEGTEPIFDADTWEKHHKRYLEKIVEANLGIEWITDFNESGILFSDENYTDFVKECLNILKSQYKVGISFNKDALDKTLALDKTNKANDSTYTGIIDTCDFIAFNTYPPVGYVNIEKAKSLTHEEMVEAIGWYGLKDYINYINEETSKTFIITEVGCGKWWDMYKEPEINTGYSSTNQDGHKSDAPEFSNYESTARYMDAVTDYLKDISYITEVNYWYTSTASLGSGKIGEVVRKWKGEDL